MTTSLEKADTAGNPILRPSVRALAPGILATLALAFVASQLGNLVPIIGAPIFGILIGMGVVSLVGVDRALVPGIRFTAKKILQASIVLLGGTLSLSQIWQTGKGSLGVMLLSLAVGLGTAFLLGSFMGVPWRMAGLIGAGTSICGASAIAAVAPVVSADDREVAYSISTVFLFNIVAIFLFPVVGHLLRLDDAAFGLWAGTAVNDTSSVVATAFAWSPAAGSYAVVVKLARSFMIVPVTLGFVVWSAYRRADREHRTVAVWKAFPWFILGFVALAGVNSLGVIGGLGLALGAVAKLGITAALCAVGLSVDFRGFRATGFRPMLLGLITWIGVALTSIIQILAR